MGAVSKTGDRLGLSARSKAMFAAAVVKSVGMRFKIPTSVIQLQPGKGKVFGSRLRKL